MKAPTKWRAGRSQKKDQTGSYPTTNKSSNKYEVLATSAAAATEEMESQPTLDNDKSPAPTQLPHTTPHNPNHKGQAPPPTKPNPKKASKQAKTPHEAHPLPSPNPESIFDTHAFKTMRQPTTSNEAQHTVVSLTDPAQDTTMTHQSFPTPTM